MLAAIGIIVYAIKIKFFSTKSLLEDVKKQVSTLELLSELPANHSVLWETPVKKDRQWTYIISHLIISPNKVFLLNVIDEEGILTGESMDGYIRIRDEFTQQGPLIENPLITIAEHAEVFTGFLQDIRVDMPVEYGVYFSSENTTSQIDWGHSKVFFANNKQEMIAYLSQDPNQRKSKAQKKILRKLRNN